MNTYRINTDITIRWEVKVNGQKVSPMGCDLRLEVCGPNRASQFLNYSVVNTNVLVATFRGVDQRSLGMYHVSLWYNAGRSGQSVADRCYAFELINCSDNNISNQILVLDPVDINISGIQQGSTGGSIGGEMGGTSGGVVELPSTSELQEIKDRLDEQERINDEQQRQINQNTAVNASQESAIAGLGSPDMATESDIDDLFK